MTYLLAVSGGIDSVVLLDMLVKRTPGQLIVAHFDHGIRPDSKSDAEFVRLLAAKYEIPFVLKREELGAGASEELARKRRYAFLQNESKKHEATIVTAHHKNDLLETIAINIYRGTGWRGLAVMGDNRVTRPLLEFTKSELYDYALKYRLEWVEDSTNHEQKYLRNRLRRKLSGLPSLAEKKLERLWHEQGKLRKDIDEEVDRLITSSYSRYFFTSIDTNTAIELLRGLFLKEAKGSPVRSQLERALLAIKTAKPGTTSQIGEGISLRFSSASFIVEPPQKVL
jgi:tRNA(Ile)-lysidine synthase